MPDLSWRPRLGERVRVRLPKGRVCGEPPHVLEEADRLGQVVRVRAAGGGRAHSYLVLFDHPLTRDALSGWRPSVAAYHYTADELEPVAASL